MLNGNDVQQLFIVRLKKMYCYIKSYFPPYNYSKNKLEVKLDSPNYATKSDLKNATGVDTSQFAKKDRFANLKLVVDILHTDKLSELDAKN